MKTFKNDDQKYIIMALNSDNDDIVWKHAHLMPLKELTGVYKGEKERAYLLPYSEDVVNLAKAFNQESILVLDRMQNGRRIGFIRQLSNNVVINAGEFKQVDKPSGDGYTIDGDNIYEII